MSESFLAAFDPGESTGWVVLDKEGNVLATGIARGREKLYEVLEKIGEPPEVVVIEEFTLFQHKSKQQSGSKMETTRVIGVIEAWARKSKVVFQRPNIKPIAEMWTGHKPSSNHKNSHHIDALNHGMYYLYNNKILARKRPE